mgnify:CR=1 FL=1
MRAGVARLLEVRLEEAARDARAESARERGPSVGLEERGEEERETHRSTSASWPSSPLSSNAFSMMRWLSVVWATLPSYENRIGGSHAWPRSNMAFSIAATLSAPPNRRWYRSRLFSPGESGRVGSRRKGANLMLKLSGRCDERRIASSIRRLPT